MENKTPINWYKSLSVNQRIKEFNKMKLAIKVLTEWDRLNGSQLSKINNLTLEMLKELLHYDHNTGLFTRIKKSSSNSSDKHIGKIAGCKNGKGYIDIRINGVKYKAHRLAYFYHYGYIDESLQIDHINRIKTDNRICNLRLCTNSDNQKNKGMMKNNKSGEIGICKFKENRGSNKDYWLLQWRKGDKRRNKYFPYTDEGFKQAIEYRNNLTEKAKQLLNK